MRRINRALFDRNAAACEAAKHPECTCHCGGQFHGTKHSQAWRDAKWIELEAAVAERTRDDQARVERERREADPNLDLFGPAP